jgi:large subunit ribosomal protein L6
MLSPFPNKWEKRNRFPVVKRKRFFLHFTKRYFLSLEETVSLFWKSSPYVEDFGTNRERFFFLREKREETKKKIQSMKKISKITIPEQIDIEKKNNLLKISGPLGSTFLDLMKIDPHGDSLLFVDKTQKQLQFHTQSASLFGLFESLFQNKCKGVSQGFLVYLRIQGIGYRALLEGETLILKVGYSHDILFPIPQGIRIFLIEPTLLCLYGLEKNQVSQIAAKIRNCRKPDMYKAKGIRLGHEEIRIKQGKKK